LYQYGPQEEEDFVVYRETKHTDWHKVSTVERLENDGRVVSKIGKKQLLIVQTKAGVFAINNRCPHEGYPLSEGTLQDDCMLACNWHGWTFDLNEGKALQGRDPVKTYAVKIDGADIFVDLAPEPFEKRLGAAESEFFDAFSEHDYERMARALCRYIDAGGLYEDIAKQVIAESGDFLERGFGHAHAGLVDWIDLAGDDKELRLVAFLEALGHFSWDRLFSRKATMPNEALEWDEGEFRTAIESMDQNRALQLCNGAFTKGLSFVDLKPIFLRQVFAHYAGFGHPAIYVMKAEQLIDRLGKQIEQTLCMQITRYLCLAGREDLIPEFREFQTLMQFPQKKGSVVVPAASGLSGKSIRQLLPLVDGAVSSNHEKWETLLAAAAWDMLKFDQNRQDIIEQPIAQNVGWLNFTHAITFAEALYFHASEDDSFWRSGHLQQACFIGRNAKFLSGPEFDLYRVTDKKRFQAQQKAALFNMDVGEYIYAVHRVKLTVATENLLPLVSELTANLLCAALNRFLSGKVRQRQPARTAYQARVIVERD